MIHLNGCIRQIVLSFVPGNSRETALGMFRIPRWEILVAVGMLVISAGLTFGAGHYGKLIEERRLRDIALTAAVSLEAKDVRVLLASPADGSSATRPFKDLHSALVRMRAAIPDARFVYLIAKQGGQWRFLVDAEALDSKDYSPPGQVYTDDPSGFETVIATGQPFVEPLSRDQWGIWVSGEAPIRDPVTGETIAVLGIDVSAAKWVANVTAYRWAGFGISVLMVVIAGLFAIGRRRQDRHMQDLTRVATALNEQTKSVHLLNGMVQRLQEATSEEEIAEIVRGYAPQILPGWPGILFLMNNSQNLLTAIADWGTPDGTAMDFPPDNCWALRRGQAHLLQAGGNEVRCQHVHEQYKGSYACFPLLGRGGTVGLLYIQADAAAAGKDEALSTFTSNLGLALANYRLREALRVMSLRDSLTGLFNRRYLEEALVLEFGRAARSHDGIGIIVGDLDHFKRLNDTFGHDGGDMALRAVAQVLIANVRKGDIACRHGGEEFVLVLPGATLQQTQDRAEELREALAALEVNFHGKTISPITMSIGVAVFPEHGTSPEAVIRQADKAMYRAKQTGRDRIVVAASFNALES